MNTCDNCGKSRQDDDEILCRICKPSLQITADISDARAKIQKAYWNFCRQANAKPPIMVCPEAYELLAKHNQI